MEWGLELLDSHLTVVRTGCSKEVDFVPVSCADPSARSCIEASLVMELIVIVGMTVNRGAQAVVWAGNGNGAGKRRMMIVMNYSLLLRRRRILRMWMVVISSAGWVW